MRKHATLIYDYYKTTDGAGIYNKYPNISDRAHWDYLSDEFREALIESGLEAQKEPWTELLISDFREFSKSGNRVRFEDKYFPRRRKLNRLIMAECAENKGRFLDDILDGLYLILEETTWCLPPHTSYVRDAKQETMPDVTRPIIDLFDAESAALVAFAEYLLRPVFEKISPYISVYVNERLRERIFKPYLNQHFWWMGNGKEPMCNWTPWITQNVLICALTRDENFFTKEERRRFLEKAAASCDYFLDEYGDDGCCSEGAQYYSHAGLCLFGCLELMSYALESSEKTKSFEDIYREEKIRNIANYIVKMHVGGGYYINFADCSALPGKRTAREFLFGKATKDEVLSSFAAADFRTQNRAEKLIEDEINLFYHVLQAFSYDEMNRYPVCDKLPDSAWFESVGLMVARSTSITLAAKAGNNADSHNHNDVGSFTIYKDNKPFLIDLGVGTYTGKTFSDKRYEIWTMQSQFHNLPTFAEEGVEFGKAPAKDVYDSRIVMQKDGEDFKAKDVSCSLSELVMDIAPAYGDERVKKYVRRISLSEEGGVTVSDEYDGTLPVSLSLMTYEKPEATENNVIKVGHIGEIRIDTPCTTRIETYNITDERLKTAWKHEVYRIVLGFSDARNIKLKIM